ncbi:MAG TPA: response regulator transcription factor [Vicinamibacterales bacterium]|nr:response regulator transcription factor [Vicinamibacterales bacterium]
MTRLLVVEDNRDLAAGLRNNFEIDGYDVEVAFDGLAAVEAFRRRAADLVVLDLMLPGLDGPRVLREIRAVDRDVPVLVLTAKTDESDKVRLLKLGADDYVTKPFGILELLARVEVLLRRAQPPPADRFVLGEVVVDVRRRTVTRNGADVQLTPMEFDLLVALLRRQGAVASRVDLLTEVWGHASSVLTRTVDTHIAELRRKLEPDPGSPRHILTVRKTGYRIG